MASSVGAYVPINNGQINFISGYVYNQAAIMDSRGLCPDGWRLPTAQEYEDLISFLGGPVTASDALKAPDGWCSPNPFLPTGGTTCGNGTNSSGFAAYPTGVINQSGGVYEGHDGYRWTSTTYNAHTAEFLDLSAWAINGDFTNYHFNEVALVSQFTAITAGCRCVKD